jgi:hypothetical protein
MNKGRTPLIRKIGISILALLVPVFLFFLPSCQTKEFDLESTVEIALQLTLNSIPSASLQPTITRQATGTIQPTYTKLPSNTPFSTYTALPTLTPRPTYTPYPTKTARPTYTPLPTNTRWPTHTSMPTYTPLPTFTSMPTFTPLPTHTAAATYTKVPTYTPKPTYTLLPTLTAQPTYTPVVIYVMVTPTTDESILKSEKTDGFYLVGPEIEAGVWRTEEGRSKCYWKITDIKGNIISNYLGAGGGTIFIDENAYQIEILNCGKITYVETFNNP